MRQKCPQGKNADLRDRRFFVVDIELSTDMVRLPLYNWCMGRPRKWTEPQLRKVVSTSTSVRQVLHKIGLAEAGGNYDQIKKYLGIYKIDTSHFKGQGWSRGQSGFFRPLFPLNTILTKNSMYQSFKLKRRLFIEGLKKPLCEECGWAKRSVDGRVPLELDHINGNRHDNRIENLRILCPNCHSLQTTHRGKNIKMGQWRNWYTRDT